MVGNNENKIILTLGSVIWLASLLYVTANYSLGFNLGGAGLALNIIFALGVLYFAAHVISAIIETIK